MFLSFFCFYSVSSKTTLDFSIFFLFCFLFCFNFSLDYRFSLSQIFPPPQNKLSIPTIQNDLWGLSLCVCTYIYKKTNKNQPIFLPNCFMFEIFFFCFPPLDLINFSSIPLSSPTQRNIQESIVYGYYHR
jgi:hypothetical protein